MKIAMIGLRSIGQGSGGVEKAVEEMSARLVSRGHDVTVFCRTRYNPDGAVSFRGVHLINVGTLYTKHLEAFVHTALCSFRVLRGFDVVHYHATGPALFSWIPRLFGRRVVVTVHGLDWRREKWSWPAKLVLRVGAWAAAAFPHQTIVVSKTLRAYYAERRKRVHFIPNGVTAMEHRPLDKLKQFGVEPQKFILYLGRLVPEKGCHELIEAFRQWESPVRLLIAGDATHSASYESSLREAATGDERIIFSGPLFGDAKEEAFSNALCFILPSSLEGLPIVLLEAMAAGCPVICSNIPELVDVVACDTEGPIAHTYHVHDKRALKDALDAVARDPQCFAERAKRAQRMVLRDYTWDSAVDRAERIYLDAVGDA